MHYKILEKKIKIIKIRSDFLEERYFKILLHCGHVGTGKFLEVARYVTAKDCVQAFTLGNRLPRTKRKKNKTGTVSVKEITRMEYYWGLLNEATNPYLNIIKRKGRRVCG